MQARSSDGRWLLRADNDARALLAFDAGSGALARRIAVADKRGLTSRVAHIVDASARRSFIALLADLPEAWELLYDPNAGPVFDGLVHDYRMGEGLASGGPLPVRRITLDVPLADGLFSPDHAYFVARAGDGVVHVVSLDVRRVIERLRLGGEPRPEQGVAWSAGGERLFAFPDAGAARVLIVSSLGWRTPRAVDLPQPARAVTRDSDGFLYVESAVGRRLRIDLPR
jgi:hypothetical protein